MNQNELVTVIELSSSGIRLVSGYDNGQTLVILYSVISEPLQIDEQGHIDKNTAMHYLADLIQKAKSRLSDLGGIILLIPPKGFEVRSEHYSTATASRQTLVTLQDYRNCLAMVEKGVHTPVNKRICYISPLAFGIDTQKGMKEFPLSQPSRMLDLDCDVQFLDIAAYDFAHSILSALGISPYLTLVSTFCAATLMDRSKAPKDYLSLNMERGYTEIGYVKGGRLVSSQYLKFGIMDVISIASKALGVTKKRAEELLNVFGFRDQCGFEYLTDEGKTLRDLSQAFEEGIDGFILRVKTSIEEIPAELPVLFYGQYSRVPLLPEALSKKMGRQVMSFNSYYIGARDQEYVDCLGGICLGGEIYQRPVEEETPLPQDNPTMGFHR